MYGTFMRENREIPCSSVRLITGWAVQGTRVGTPEMHERGKSDRPVVPANPPNKAVAAEVGEERGRAKGNTAGKTHPGHSAGQGASSALGRVREVARRDRHARFTALLHHVTVSRLRAGYWAVSPKAAPGVDGVTWIDYGKNLEANLADLHERV
jgi:RNA-directed DNA polymerase